MSDFDFAFEQTPWDATLDMLRPGDSFSAVRFLALMEGEEEEVLEDAFQDLEDRHVALHVSQLPLDYGTGETQKRLRREEMLVKSGKLLENLEENDPLRMYLEELAAIPAQGDPQLLAQEYAAGKETVMQQLVNVTISRAIQAACGMTGRGVLLLDLIQEANLGLWQSILHYESGDFETHADWWIQQYLARTVIMQARQNGVGIKMKKAMEDYRSADKRLLTELGRNPSLEEIALEMHISPEEAEVYQDMLRTARTMEKAKTPTPGEEPEDQQAVENTAYFQSRQRIAEMLSTLTSLEAEVLNLRFGLEGGQPYTAQEVGAKLNLTADQVVALETAALAKLRKEG